MGTGEALEDHPWPENHGEPVGMSQSRGLLERGGCWSRGLPEEAAQELPAQAGS